MKLNIITILIVLIISYSCNHKKEPSISDKGSNVTNTPIIDQSESYKLFKDKCYACHSVKSESHDNIIAPPMAAVKMRYLRSYSNREEFINAIVNWAKDPKEENALMYGAVQQFKVMPKQQFYDKDLELIGAYIFDNEIEQPEWFETHFQEEIGGRGKGRNRRRGM